MPNNNNVHCTELPKLINKGVNNNYGKWKVQSYHKLREWDLLKYIKGPDSDPPNIPPLRQQQMYHGVNNDGNISTTHILGNAAEHLQAVAAAKLWMDRNNTALAHIIMSVYICERSMRKSPFHVPTL